MYRTIHWTGCAALLWATAIAAQSATAEEIGLMGDEPIAEYKDCCGACPWFGVELFAGIDNNEGVHQVSREADFGGAVGANLGFAIAPDFGIGGQIGGSWGVYDWGGRLYDEQGDEASAQQQGFLTVGLFRETIGDSRWSLGLAHDWLITDNFGNHGLDPTLGQWRGQVEYAINPCNEIGMQFVRRDRGDSLSFAEFGGPTAENFRAISHTDLYWHHAMHNGTHMRLWVGLPDQEDRLPGNQAGETNTVIDTLFGASIQTPITHKLDVFARFQYGSASANSGNNVGNADDASNVAIGLVYYPGRSSRQYGVTRNCWMPYMPMANNSNFLVDRGFTYDGRPGQP